jgi:site-specific DNA recombinase
VNAKLVVNPSESRQVLGTFELYETLRSYPATCKELALRGWRTKSWVNKNGRLVLSKPYTKTLLSSLLHNPLYAGKTQLRGEIFDGQHEAIVDVDLWSKVQEILADKNHLTPGKERNKYVVMLHQRVYCARCGTRMNYKPSTDADTGRTNFYLSCQTYQKKRSDACPGSHIRASIVEEFVVSRIRRLGENPTVTRESFAAALDALRTQPDKVKTVLQDVANELERLTAQRLDIVTIDEKEQPDVKTRLEGIDRQIAAVQQRAAELRQDLEALNHDDVDAEDHRQAFAAFTPIWDHLRAEEKMRVLALLIERVAVDVLGNRIDITFRDNGLPEIESPSAA